MNIDVNSVLYLFLFILPGAFSKILRRRFSPVKLSIEQNKGNLIQTSEIVVISFLIFCLNCLVIKGYRYIRDVSGQFSVIENLSRTDFLIKYILLTFVITALFTCGYFYFDKCVLSKIINLTNKWMGRPQETEKHTLWEEVFETNQFEVFQEDNIIIGVEKDGKEIAFGVLDKYPSPSTECDDIILKYGSILKEYMEEDKYKPIQEKRIGRVDFEYVIFSKGITLKFYNNENYKKYLKDYYSGQE